MGNAHGRRGSILGRPKNLGIIEPLEEGWEKIEKSNNVISRSASSSSASSEEAHSDNEGEKVIEKKIKKPRKKKSGSRLEKVDEVKEDEKGQASEEEVKVKKKKRKKKKKKHPPKIEPEEPIAVVPEGIEEAVVPAGEENQEKQDGEKQDPVANEGLQDNKDDDPKPEEKPEAKVDEVKEDDKVEEKKVGDEVEDDEFSLVRKWLEQQQEKKAPAEKKDESESSDSESEAEGDVNFCLLCEKTVPAGGERENYFVLEKCQHGFCVECLYKYVDKLLGNENQANEKAEALEGENEKDEKEEKPEKVDEVVPEDNGEKGEQAEVKEEPDAAKQKLVCPLPGCGCDISIRDLSIGLAEFADRQKQAKEEGEAKLQSTPNVLTNSLRMLIEGNSDFILCPNEKCCAVFERVPPSESEKKAVVRDDDGQPLNPGALEDYHQNRFRCRNCDTVFCTGCKKVPYHLGYTCELFEAFQKSDKKCVICSKAVAPQTKPYFQELKDEEEGVPEKEDAEGKGKEKEPLHGPIVLRPRPTLGRRDQIFFWRKKKLLNEIQEWEKEKEEFEKREKEEQERLEKEREEKERQEQLRLEKQKKKEQKEKERAERKARGEEVELDPADQLIFVCESEECREVVQERCLKRNEICGHLCTGIAHEKECMDCIHRDCSTGNQNADDFCNICWIEDLGSKPSVCLSSCGHIFHHKCIKERLEARWPTPVISFTFMDCPLCNKRMEHPAFESVLKPLNELEHHIKELAVERLKIEKLEKDKVVKQKVMSPEEFALSIFTFYLCYKCKAPYFGGRRACGELGGGENHGEFNPKELICGACSNVDGRGYCRIHGEEYIEWKCRFCCSIATFYCAGKARFCTPCHDKPAERVEFNNWTTLPQYLEHAPACKGASECPLAIDHPPNGTEEFCIGCAMCKSSDFRVEKKDK